jgi:hypothetical protein
MPSTIVLFLRSSPKGCVSKDAGWLCDARFAVRAVLNRLGVAPINPAGAQITDR